MVMVADRQYVPWAPTEDCQDPLDATLEPTVSHDLLRRAAKDRQLQAREQVRCERSPWYFLVNYFVTEDQWWREKGWKSPHRTLPPKRYLQTLAHYLWAERFVVIPKSRQMMVTWLVAGYILGDAMFTGGRLYMFQSQDEAQAVAVLRDRLMGAYDRLTEFAPWLATPVVRRADTYVRFANGSVLRAVAHGAHQLQSHTPSWWIADEFQLHEDAAESYGYALACCERITCIGSADFGFMYEELLQDRLGGGSVGAYRPGVEAVPA